MANTYKFHIYTTDCFVDYDGLSDVIQNVHWGYEVSDGSNSTTMIGVTTMDIPSSENFIAFDQLDKATVIQWLESKLDVSGMQSSLDKKLDEMVNPTIIQKQLPDDSESEEPLA